MWANIFHFGSAGFNGTFPISLFFLTHRLFLGTPTPTEPPTPHITFEILQRPFGACANDAMNHRHNITHVVAACYLSRRTASYLPATPGCKSKPRVGCHSKE